MKDLAKAFGHSLALTDGDIAIENGSMRAVSGLENLAQSLSLHLATPYGTDLFDQRYGLDLTSVWHRVNRPVTTLTITKAEIHLKIVEALNRDTRVREVREVAFDDGPRFFELSPSSDPVTAQTTHSTERSWRAIVVVDVGLDDTIALLAEGERLGP